MISVDFLRKYVDCWVSRSVLKSTKWQETHLSDHLIQVQFSMSEFDKFLEESVHRDVIPGAVLYAQDKDGQSRRTLTSTSMG